MLKKEYNELMNNLNSKYSEVQQDLKKESVEELNKIVGRQ
jgi:Skp family chaperone for outer membrane proteins